MTHTGGQQRIGSFAIVSELGRGGMGQVFLARQEPMERLVALKLLPPELARDETFQKRFLREARAAAAIRHPNVVGVLDAGMADGRHFIAFEFVDGPSLQALVKEGGPLPEARVLRYLIALNQGLGGIHAAGLVHRDVKPDNILVARQSDVPRLADLGLVKRSGEGASQETALTVPGAVLGTPLYMSPEQAVSDEVDARADLYSLGLTAHYMLTGKVPFDGDGDSALKILSRRLNSDPPDLRQVAAVSDGLAITVAGMCAREVDERYRDAAHLATDLERLAAGMAPFGPTAAFEATVVGANLAGLGADDATLREAPPGLAATELEVSTSAPTVAPQVGGRVETGAAQGKLQGVDLAKRTRSETAGGARSRRAALLVLAAGLFVGLALAAWIVSRPSSADVAGASPRPSPPNPLVDGTPPSGPNEEPAPTQSPREQPSPSTGGKPAPSKTPAPTKSPDPRETPAPTKSPDPRETPAPTKSPDPRETPAPTKSPDPRETPSPTKSPDPRETPAPTKSPDPRETPSPTKSPRPTKTPAPSPAPSPRPSPAPSSTPTPGEGQESLIVTSEGALPAAVERAQRASLMAPARGARLVGRLKRTRRAGRVVIPELQSFTAGVTLARAALAAKTAEEFERKAEVFERVLEVCKERDKAGPLNQAVARALDEWVPLLELRLVLLSGRTPRPDALPADHPLAQSLKALGTAYRQIVNWPRWRTLPRRARDAEEFAKAATQAPTTALAEVIGPHVAHVPRICAALGGERSLAKALADLDPSTTSAKDLFGDRLSEVKDGVTPRGHALWVDMSRALAVGADLEIGFYRGQIVRLGGKAISALGSRKRQLSQHSIRWPPRPVAWIEPRPAEVLVFAPGATPESFKLSIPVGEQVPTLRLRGVENPRAFVLRLNIPESARGPRPRRGFPFTPPRRR